MIYGSIHCLNYKNNELFVLGSGMNSGDFFLPYRLLRETFLKNGIELNTPDINKGKSVSFELHINAQAQHPRARAYVYLFENPLIRPLNRNIIVLNHYARWFAWDEELSNDSRFVKLFYPNKTDLSEWAKFESRSKFLVLVARNKDLNILDPKSLVPLRQEIIQWYETHAPDDFYLYGRGWNRPFATPGRWGKFLGQIQKFIPLFHKPLQTWRGTIKNKIELLQGAKFCIAHENCRDLSGYITEKIFHCFRAGCVPIYIGPKEINDYIPSECFIDGRKFENPADLDIFLRSINSEAYRNYQNSIKEFLTSKNIQPFSENYFVEVLVQTIVADLRRDSTNQLS